MLEVERRLLPELTEAAKRQDPDGDSPRRVVVLLEVSFDHLVAADFALDLVGSGSLPTDRGVRTLAVSGCVLGAAVSLDLMAAAVVRRSTGNESPGREPDRGEAWKRHRARLSPPARVWLDRATNSDFGRGLTALRDSHAHRWVGFSASAGAGAGLTFHPSDVAEVHRVDHARGVFRGHAGGLQELVTWVAETWAIGIALFHVRK